MANRESSFKNMVVTLFLVTFFAATALGFVYNMTKEAIELTKMKTQGEAIEKVLPDFEKLGEAYNVPARTGEDSLQIFPAYEEGKLVGAAVKTFTYNGFSGYISIMAGIDSSGVFSGYEVLEHSETPGLGSKMMDWFKNTDKPGQCVIGKNPASHQFEVSKDGGDIDAITASTITSRAFLDALERAYKAYEEKEEVISGKNGK
jgi:Na+-translocating ferredoxin:NAD+ oxidoreductase subunit G